ncbi:MAG: hypothetical protein AUG89_11420 [Acidobacteria bacterium 13_1_20CM_4_56_7]|nr:MAG: hypothetical protein AUG89_11420 [Acidobacteria bacterium 13_1_20CM_4_56_7]
MVRTTWRKLLSVSIRNLSWIVMLAGLAASGQDLGNPSLFQPGDFVELSRSGCYGECPAYSVRVFEDGDVIWNGKFYVKVRGEKHSRITQETARSLLRRFVAPEFWALNNLYSSGVTDNPTTTIEVRIGGKSKRVSDYAKSAPEFEQSLEDAIDDVVDTHRWRHGDPRTEPLSNIFQDATMPKVGVTSLMRAAVHGDDKGLQDILRMNPKVDAIDSSGWTALMYAETTTSSDSVNLLLKAGADPNHKSFQGDTPLMVSAMSQLFDGDLAEAGANVNAANTDGTTALMILAAKGEGDEVRDALKAGADASLRDNYGRTALDYLRSETTQEALERDWF